VTQASSARAENPTETASPLTCRATAVALLLVACASAWCTALTGAASASAATRSGLGVGDGPPVALTASFQPDRLGAATAISFAIQIEPPEDDAILPLSTMEVVYPANLGLATSGLGVEACDPAVLAVDGAGACPPDSKMGEGSALVDVPIGPRILHERVALGIYASPSNDGYLHLAIIAAGAQPVIAQIVLSAVLLDGHLQIGVPPIATLPGAPFATLVNMQATIGGRLTYYEHAHGRTIAYHPRGIGLPDTCPQGGWKLAASLAFIDGRSSHAGTAVRCPGGGT